LTLSLSSLIVTIKNEAPPPHQNGSNMDLCNSLLPAIYSEEENNNTGILLYCISNGEIGHTADGFLLIHFLPQPRIKNIRTLSPYRANGLSVHAHEAKFPPSAPPDGCTNTPSLEYFTTKYYIALYMLYPTKLAFPHYPSNGATRRRFPSNHFSLFVSWH